jgi:hypothetical protein
MTEHDSMSPRPGRSGLNRVYFITPDGIGSSVKTNGRAKITYVRTDHPGDPDDAISWQASAE